MSTHRKLQTTALLLSIGVGVAFSVCRAPAAAGASEPLLEDFAVIWENNIFDPSRRPGLAADDENGSAPPPEPESLALLGTMISAEEHRAIFGGSQPGFQITGTEGDVIAGFTLLDVRIGGVQVRRDSEEEFLPVGKTIELQTTGELSIGEAAMTSSVPARPSQVEPEAGAKNDTDASPADQDVLETLRQRRKKEMKR
ncbi:MAG: hypothetical protein IT364_04995 [Candidatus Hydrogenedentes bacterium]|nr:hypothetical protein [Candidatus Hydrogenedentota bacterium]